jgi:hypothetical protein
MATSPGGCINLPCCRLKPGKSHKLMPLILPSRSMGNKEKFQRRVGLHQRPSSERGARPKKSSIETHIAT